jgi:alkylation response protein AidB-like acyl-CoA dehydrogenase
MPPAADWAEGLVEAAAAAGEDIPAALRLTRAYAPMLPLPGRGRTAERWATLSALGRANLTSARVFEAHTDAVAILAEAGAVADPEATFGVFAAEGPGEPLRATGGGAHYRLSGVKPWCSLGSELDCGLVTAHVEGGRQLFRADLHDRSVMAEPTSGWVARGLRTVTSTSLRFDATPAQPVGDVDWYLTRPGFSWGGIGVAACWYGGALALQDRLHLGPATGRNAGASPAEGPSSSGGDEVHALHLGTVDVALYAAGAVLAQAAAIVDQGEATGATGELLAMRVRAVVVAAAERALREVEHALGPAPLAFEEDHARRVADLAIYLRQHHAERDLAALGHAIS